MENFLLRGLNYLRLLCFPFWFLVPWGWRRWHFEEKNLTDSACKSWGMGGQKADYAFEVSSEGELEQVRFLLESILQEGKRIELLFCSPSASKKCQNLYQHYPQQIRLLCLPLISIGIRQNIQHWLTAPTLVLCRYDFFPELLLYGHLPEVQILLVSACLKKRRPIFWQCLIYQRFARIICPNSREKEKFEALGISPSKIKVCCFRSHSIHSRLKKARATLDTWKELVNWIETFPVEKRFIIGSAWIKEMEIFKDAPFREEIAKGESMVMVAPHQLSPTFLGQIKLAIKGHLPIYPLDDVGQISSVIAKHQEAGGAILFTPPGLLVEWYSLFGQAIIGGGHGAGVHSLLEPFWANCRIYCGPKVSRSTEYDTICDNYPQLIKTIEKWSSFSSHRASVPTERREVDEEGVLALRNWFFKK